jgi:hypothetical protein
MELNMKYLLITAALASLAISGVVRADTMATCDDATMMKVETDLKGMKETDQAMKDKMMMGMEELDKAKMAMREHKDSDCAMHLDSAMKAAMGQ